jgi:hypothetical protein
VHGTLLTFIFVGALLVALGVAGFFNERRRRGPAGVRRFLVWYCLAWPFAAAAVCATEFPRLHWLILVSFGISGVGSAVRMYADRRARARPAGPEPADAALPRGGDR